MGWRLLPLFAMLVQAACSVDATPGSETTDTMDDALPDTPDDTTADTLDDTTADTPDDTMADTPDDTTADTSPDTLPDTTPDTTPDTSPDTTPDTSPDTTPDTLPDTTPDTVQPAPLGAFCGTTPTCTAATPGWPRCHHEQCASRRCLAFDQVALASREVCTRGCTIYQDVAPFDGVNDANAAFEDCAPDDAVDGPAGRVFRCVDFAQVNQHPVGVCLPGTTFASCSRDEDCPDNEVCEITNIRGTIAQRCMAKYRETPNWTAQVNGLSERCNADITSGAVEFCEGGLCLDVGCASLCASNADCDTTPVRPGSGCGVDGKCLTHPSRACTSDVDCSAFHCRQDFPVFGVEFPQFKFDICFPNHCDTDADCGGDFYCRSFWNGLPGSDAALDGLCLSRLEGGADLGEACVDPTQTSSGNLCKNEDLCVGGFCSTLCRDDEDCSTAGGQRCTVAELPGDFDDNDEPDFVLPFQRCETFPGHTTECLSSADCLPSETCKVYEVANYLANGTTLHPDGPYTLAGVCQPFNPNPAAPDFPGDAGAFGQPCTTGSDCRSGTCYPTDEAGTQRICVDVCQSSEDCPDTVQIGQQTANTLCVAFLYGWGGDLADPAKNIYLGLCLADPSSLDDCSDDYTCSGTESCLPNEIAAGPTTPAKVEYLCVETWETAAQRGTKTLGEACDPNAAIEMCDSGLCVPEPGNSTLGYCSQLCDMGDPCGNGTTCLDVTRIARVGAYANNAASYGLCLKDQLCSRCTGQWDCPGDLACVNLGGSNLSANHRCVPACTSNADCTEPGLRTCYDSVDASGRPARGCFNKNAGGLPVNRCL
ncbi:MAG TPA: hypothetical protein PK095_08425 [Myxococcota bacterium]|nr:hypothetical protein [Myxococcota bacterium]